MSLDDFRIRRVDTNIQYIYETLLHLNARTFPDPEVPPINPGQGEWWVVFGMGELPVGFASLGWHGPNYGYLTRSGVLPRYRGWGLQRRLIKVREMHAKKAGKTHMITYTISNPHSANNLIKAGYKTFEPRTPLAEGPNVTHWRKKL